MVLLKINLPAVSVTPQKAAKLICWNKKTKTSPVIESNPIAHLILYCLFILVNSVQPHHPPYPRKKYNQVDDAGEKKFVHKIQKVRHPYRNHKQK
jgi:hypothetical protein